MKELIKILLCIFSLKMTICLKLSFISWNVNDNRKFDEYNAEIVSSLLRLDSTESKDLPDVYAITFQENCINCKDSNVNKIATPFIETLKSVKKIDFKLIGIHSTRTSSLCERIYCISIASMHGSTLMMILAKDELKTSNVFIEKVNGCTTVVFGNKEKGVAAVGFTENEIKYCFGGLHLDVSKNSNRQECIAKVLDKMNGKCDVIFFGGDFNTRPQSKDTPKPNFYDGGYNKSLFLEMATGDDLSGSNPHSGNQNLINSIYENNGIKFIEPFNKPPEFIPTYSIDSSIKCPYSPVCYKASKYPSWTDRIIFTSSAKIMCHEYSVIKSLSHLSDHLPVFASCKTN